MLVMLPKQMKDLPFEKMFPYDDNNICIALSPQVIALLSDIKNDEGSMLSVRAIYEADPNTFGNQDFTERLEEFCALINTKFLRFFVTKKDKFLFFDEIEQEALSKVMNSHALTAKVSIFVMGENGMREIDLNNVSLKGYAKIKKYIKELNAFFLMKPDTFIDMMAKAKYFDSNVRPRYRGDVDRKLSDIFKKYPEFKEAKTKTEFKTIYHDLTKKLHPDVNKEEDASEKFQDMNDAAEYVMKTRWYKEMSD